MVIVISVWLLLIKLIFYYHFYMQIIEIVLFYLKIIDLYYSILQLEIHSISLSLFIFHHFINNWNQGCILKITNCRCFYVYELNDLNDKEINRCILKKKRKVDAGIEPTSALRFDEFPALEVSLLFHWAIPLAGKQWNYYKTGNQKDPKTHYFFSILY